MKKGWKYLIGIVVVVVIVIAGYFSFGGQSQAKEKTITIGLVAPTDKDTHVWDAVKKEAKDNYGLTIKLKEFSDWNQPNKAVANGELDANSFQTKEFLDEWNKAHDNALTSVGQTIITPLRLYSKKVDSVADIKNGATITISNDAVNEARGLKLLQNAGLIKLKSDDSLATTKDIVENPKNLKIKEVDGSQTARALSSEDASVVNGGFAVSGDIPLKYTLYKEKLDKNSKPYINVLAVSKKKKDSQAFKDLAKAYQSKSVKKEIEKQYNSLIIPGWDLDLD